MESTQIRAIVAASVVLLALTGLLALPDASTSVSLDPEATARVVEATDPTRAIGIRIEQASGEREGTIALAKQDGVWRVQEPFAADADVDRVVAVLDAVRESERGVPVQGDPASFGLEPPQAIVTVAMDDGSTRVLALGNAAPVGWRTYARAADGTVAAVSGRPGEEILVRPGEFRDHAVFRYDPADVTAVAIERNGERMAIRKTPDGWFVDGMGRADLQELDFLLTDLLAVRVDMFLDLDHTTIDDPQRRVEITTAEGTQVLLVGRDTPHGPLVFWGDGLDGVIPPPALEPLGRGPKQLAAHEAFPTFRDDRTTAIARSGAITDRVVRPAETWGDHPVASALRDAQVVQSWEPAPWSGPELTVALEGESPATVDIGPVDAEGFRAVKDRAGGVAQRVPAEELEAIFAP